MDEREWLLERYNEYKDTIRKLKEKEVNPASREWLVIEIRIAAYKRFMDELDLRLLTIGYNIREADSE